LGRPKERRKRKTAPSGVSDTNKDTMSEVSALIEVKVQSDEEEKSSIELGGSSSSPPSTQSAVMTRNQGTLIITRRIKPECEEDHREWLERIQAACEASPGYVDRKVYPPSGVLAAENDFWTHLIKFDTLEHAKLWTASATCEQLWAEVRPWVAEESMGFMLTDPQGSTTLGIMPTGTNGTVPKTPLPIKYRQCLIVLFALYPTMLVIAVLMEFVYGTMKTPIPLRLFIGAGLSVPALTFICIPFLMNYLGPWSFGSSAISARQDLGITLGLLGGLAVLTVVMSCVWPADGYAGDGIFA